MTRRFAILILLCCSVLLPFATPAALFSSGTGNAFVPVDQAFTFDFQQNGDRLRLNWQIRPGYYLYQRQIRLQASQATLGEYALPTGKAHHDEFYGQVTIYTDALRLEVPLRNAGEGASISVTYQGCAEAGFCYPPETRVVPLSALNGAVAPDAASAAIAPFSAWWALLIGVGVAFTPCVLPMYPLISSLILGRRQSLSTGRTLLLSLVYVQGMALTYTLLGLIVAAAGLPLQAALQHPAVLITLSALFIALALSMFGLYTLQLPSTLQTRLTLWSNRQQSGSLPGVFGMGAIAGLICSPCTTAPLSAILLYIAQSGDILAGGGTLYLYALGMGLPLILVTLFGHRLLPRSGPWMQYVKEAFGFVILTLPVFLLERILGDAWSLRLWSLLGVAFCSWAFILSLRSQRGWMRGIQWLFLLAALVAARPLQDWAFPPAAVTPAGQSSLQFTHVTDRQTLRQALTNARQPIMLDLYADWCVACKEFEKYTFRDSLVRQQLAGVRLLQADVTHNSPEQRALLKELEVLGLPTILFFDAGGQEIPASRVTGYMDARQFQAHLQKIHFSG
ncbi:protein-disulfide reductase DsbD [Affinibrenneria salicis]|uniref:Thiol:disulfide interchange protein DsbD n=1 Tax=Affinibrenneria salicis TaxID=2590031 RepID=A0A5J5G6E3_9GAMM|nr:protein-disulfide reductase DsbD [Affinibrenneria salicis]KAA9002843.1 protein-disulfide reductase DsbD [Affinibrenneria salicis]KAA9002870.1 protein-disulfide reductase DsbD [Affinibrenneria salicis]